jgi:hypothetical protein
MVKSLHQHRGSQPHDSAIAYPIPGAALPPRIFLATYWRRRPGLPGLSHLWSGLRIRLHNHAPNWPPCDTPGRAEGAAASFNSNLIPSLVQRTTLFAKRPSFSPSGELGPSLNSSAPKSFSTQALPFLRTVADLRQSSCGRGRYFIGNNSWT